jgi:hypothetical protein
LAARSLAQHSKENTKMFIDDRIGTRLKAGFSAVGGIRPTGQHFGMDAYRAMCEEAERLRGFWANHARADFYGRSPSPRRSTNRAPLYKWFTTASSMLRTTVSIGI